MIFNGYSPFNNLLYTEFHFLEDFLKIWIPCMICISLVWKLEPPSILLGSVTLTTPTHYWAYNSHASPTRKNFSQLKTVYMQCQKWNPYKGKGQHSMSGLSLVPRPYAGEEKRVLGTHCLYIFSSSLGNLHTTPLISVYLLKGHTAELYCLRGTFGRFWN